MINAILDESTPIGELIEHFNELLHQHIQQSIQQQRDLSEQLETISSLDYRKLAPNSRSDAETKRKQIALKLVKQQVSARITQLFSPIDQRLFDLGRWVEVIWGSENEPPRFGQEWRSLPPDLTLVGEPLPKRKRVDGEPIKQVLKLPLIATRSLRFNHIRLQHPRIRSSWSGWHNVKCEFPGEIPPDLEHQAAEAQAIFYRVMAEAVLSSWGDVVVREVAQRPPTVDAIWIPRLEDISTVPIPPQTRDPALIVQYDQQQFLVGLWEVPEEESLEHLLGEFTG